MNIEIANRLVALRKEKSLSQEALANQLGISRQAVSKWERAESSPDTDNLILLAKLYNISLDELLQTDQEKFESGEKQTEAQEEKEEASKDTKEDFVHINFKEGIHVKDKNGDEVRVGWNGIHVNEGTGDEVIVNGSGVHVNGEKYNYKKESKKHFPYIMIVVLAYVYIGVQYNLWHPGWLIFGLIPIIESLYLAIKNRDMLQFAFPVVVLLYIGYYGFVEKTWYPYTLSLITIPAYYSIVGYLQYRIKGRS